MLLLFEGVFALVPVSLADKLGQHPTIGGFTTKAVTGLAVLGGEGRLQDLLVLNLDLLTSLDIIKFNAHLETPLYIGDQNMFRYTRVILPQILKFVLVK